MHESWRCCQIFTDIKPLGSPHLHFTSPFLPWQISEKTLGNFMDLLKIKPTTLKGAWPPLQHWAALATSVVSVLCGSLGSWCITSAAHITRRTLPSFHPLPPPLPWFHTPVPKFTLSSLFLSLPPYFLLTAGKNFVHTSSEPGTKLHFVTTTCPSASSDQDGGRHHQTASTPA